MREYACRQTAILLKRLSDRLYEAAREVNADAIHDVRVATRRLSRCLRLFAQFYPDRSWKKLRRQLSALMDLAGAVRDCDIALELLAQAGVSARAAVVVRLKGQRRKTGRDLLSEVRRWEEGKLLHLWKGRLEV
jgi:CHAD domain-containing protein